jgi:cell wall-associated NlpC family hydrolase
LELNGVAAADVEGLCAARDYRQPTFMTLTTERGAIRRAPDASAEQMDELVFGEGFEGLCAEGSFMFGRAVRDGYVGWVEAAALEPYAGAPSHRIGALFSLVLEEPSLRAPVRMRLCMNALVSTGREEGRFTELKGGGFAPTRHLRPLGAFAEDPVVEALKFLGVPYHWGGRTALGVDCSGLVQQAFYACGLACPRDSDQQESLGRAICAAGTPPTHLQRGDLVFWKGHVGVMTDPSTLLHANAYHMAVAQEPLAEAIDRIEAAGGGPTTAFRRP